jgi:hypothetical protein
VCPRERHRLLDRCDRNAQPALRIRAEADVGERQLVTGRLRAAQRTRPAQPAVGPIQAALRQRPTAQHEVAERLADRIPSSAKLPSAIRACCRAAAAPGSASQSTHAISNLAHGCPRTSSVVSSSCRSRNRAGRPPASISGAARSSSATSASSRCRPACPVTSITPVGIRDPVAGHRIKNVPVGSQSIRLPIPGRSCEFARLVTRCPTSCLPSTPIRRYVRRRKTHPPRHHTR